MIGPHPLVGVMGKKRSGKSTAAARLIAAHGYTAVSLAAPLRQALLALDPLLEHGWCGDCSMNLADVLDEYDGWEGLKESPYAADARRLLQRFGTEVGREMFGSNFWVDIAMQSVDAINGPVVVPDVRFVEEVEAIESRGGVLLRIDRPDIKIDDRASHISETALDGYTPHAVIKNEGGLEYFESAVDDFAQVVSERTRPTLSPNAVTEEIA